MSKTSGINRRSFIKQSTLGILGGGIMSRAGFSRLQEATEGASPQIKEYRTLGGTGFKISDLGTGQYYHAL